MKLTEIEKCKFYTTVSKERRSAAGRPRTFFAFVVAVLQLALHLVVISL
jgi:hypothetical protein